jgi:Holliday junction DNA helicase RuvB
MNRGMTSQSERLVAPERLPTERIGKEELALRPQRFDEIIGQAQVVNNLKVFVEAARQRQDALDHVLLSGPPGLGKTTLAHLVANELGVNLHISSGPALERKDIAGLLSHLEARDVLFIDEIHRLPAVAEEILYPAMEDFKIDFVVRGAADSRALQLNLPPFTLIGATTRTGLLTGPMRDRFGILLRLNYYSAPEIELVVRRAASILGIPCEPSGAAEIAHRSRGTPRIANRLLRRVRDFAQVEGNGVVDAAIAKHALNRLGIDEHGFDAMDRRLLETLVMKFSGGPVGLDTLGAALGEQPDSLESVYEPFLLQQGFLQRTPRGRVATEHAYRLLGLEPPPRPSTQHELFGGG